MLILRDTVKKKAKRLAIALGGKALTLSVYSGGGGGIELSKVNTILDKYEKWDPFEALIPILQDVQHELGFIPDPVAALITERFGVPLTQVYGVATFYSDFKVIKKAEHRILLCEGSACYLCGNQPLVTAIQQKLGIDYDQVTPDKQWTLQRGNYCFGACQLAPMAEIDHTVYGSLTPASLGALIDDVNSGKIDTHGGHEPVD